MTSYASRPSHEGRGLKLDGDLHIEPAEDVAPRMRGVD